MVPKMDVKEQLALVRRAPAVPATVQDLLDRRTMKKPPTLADFIEPVHLRLWPNSEYQKYCVALFSVDSVEGTTTADDFAAAMMIRESAKEHGDVQVAKAGLASIRKYLVTYVWKRFKMTRKQRRAEINIDNPNAVDDDDGEE